MTDTTNSTANPAPQTTTDNTTTAAVSINAPEIAPAASHAPSSTTGVDAQTKLNNLMSIISGTQYNTDPSGNNGGASATAAGALVPLPSFEDLIKEVNEKQMTDPQPLPPIVTADVMDCFRLYFGSSVTTFPFYSARLGAVGFVFVISAAGYLGLMTQMALHRARYNLILLELQRRMDREHGGGAGTITSATIEMGAMTPTSCGTTPSGSPSSPHPIVSGDKAGKKKKKAKPPADPSDMMPVFFKTDTMVKTCNALWPDHWMKQLFSAITFVAQFFGCCSYTLLFASNIGPVLGLGNNSATYLGAALMAVLTMATQPKAKTFLAYVNNAFIFGGACIILFGSFIHERSAEEEAMSLQIFPKSTAELAMYAPSVLTYISAQLLTIDAESIVAMRAYRVMQGKTPEPSPESLATTPAVSLNASPVSQTSPSGFPTPMHSSVGSVGLFSAAFEGLKAETLKKSLINVQTVQACYKRSVQLGMWLSVAVLVFFAELIMYCFKDNTNAIIALSFPASTIRTAILICLSIGLYACGALNISPICDMLDTFCKSLAAMEFMPIVKQAISRAVLFICVVGFLYLVPFFDMVAGLSGAICTPMFAFFIPSACELQSEILRAASRPDLKDMMSTASNLTRAMVGWQAMPIRGKVTMAVGMSLGAVILIFSTTSVLQEIMRRHNEGVEVNSLRFYSS